MIFPSLIKTVPLPAKKGTAAKVTMLSIPLAMLFSIPVAISAPILPMVIPVTYSKKESSDICFLPNHFVMAKRTTKNNKDRKITINQSGIFYTSYKIRKELFVLKTFILGFFSL